MNKNKVLSDYPAKSEITPRTGGTNRINVGKTERILSLAGGTLLSMLAFKRPAPAGLPMLFSGAYLLYRGVSGNCLVNSMLSRDTSHRMGTSIDVVRTVTIKKPLEQVYAYWRQLENLPVFMTHLSNVKQLDDKRSHWEVNFPETGLHLHWDAILVEEEINHLLSWRSVPGASIDNSGEVRFRRAPGDKGTEVQVALTYRPPLGEIGESIGKFLNPVFAVMVKEDVRRFKQLLETGELPTSEAQPTGRKKRKDDIRNHAIIKKPNYESALLEWNQ